MFEETAVWNGVKMSFCVGSLREGDKNLMIMDS